MDTVTCENITIPSNLFQSSLYHFDYLGEKIRLVDTEGRKAKAAAVFEDNPEIAAKWEVSKLDYYYLEELVREYNSSFAD